MKYGTDSEGYFFKQNKRKILDAFEKSNKCNFWKDGDEITRQAGFPPEKKDHVVSIIKSSDGFVSDGKGNYTTANLYREHTPFFRRIFRKT